MTPLMLIDAPSTAAINEAAHSEEEQADHLLVHGKEMKHGISQRNMVGGPGAFDCISCFDATSISMADVPRGFMYMYDEFGNHA